MHEKSQVVIEHLHARARKGVDTVFHAFTGSRGVDVLAADHEVDGAAQLVRDLPRRWQRDAAVAAAVMVALVAGVGGAGNAERKPAWRRRRCSVLLPPTRHVGVCTGLRDDIYLSPSLLDLPLDRTPGPWECQLPRAHLFFFLCLCITVPSACQGVVLDQEVAVDRAPEHVHAL